MCAYDFDMPDVIMKSRLAMLSIVGVLMLMVSPCYGPAVNHCIFSSCVNKGSYV